MKKRRGGGERRAPPARGTCEDGASSRVERLLRRPSSMSLTTTTIGPRRRPQQPVGTARARGFRPARRCCGAVRLPAAWSLRVVTDLSTRASRRCRAPPGCGGPVHLPVAAGPVEHLRRPIPQHRPDRAAPPNSRTCWQGDLEHEWRPNLDGYAPSSAAEAARPGLRTAWHRILVRPWGDSRQLGLMQCKAAMGSFRVSSA